MRLLKKKCHLSTLLLLLGLCGSSSSDATRARLRPKQRELSQEDQPRPETDWVNQEEFVLELTERLKPRELQTRWDEATNQTVYTERQFFHLHHMKTGGTSINGLLWCAMGRMEPKVSMYSLSECSGHSYYKCIREEQNSCRTKVASSAAMQYCAPLFQTNEFGWNEADGITVLRHPVDRVWSMFRFQTKSCYKCQNLTDVYKDIDEKGQTGDEPGSCVPQLLSHQTRNLLTSPVTEDFSDEEKLAEALQNLRQRFAVVGLTEELALTAQMIGHAFPWAAEHLEGDEDEDAKACPLPHANASPSNNRCGPGNTHWDLPDHPDEATRQAILEHNQLDLKLYEAAVEYFELQKQALGWGEDVE